MNFRRAAMVIAGLSQPLSDRPDYGSTASYLDEPSGVKDPKKLENWTKTSEGQDLLSLVKQVIAQSKKPTAELPNVLKKLGSSASDVLLNLLS